MLTDDVTLPFSIPSLVGGFAEIHGLLCATASGLRLEFEMKDSVIGLLRSGTRELAIAYDDLRGLELNTGLFRTRLTIETTRMASLEGIYGSQQGRLELRVRRSDRRAARSLVSTVELIRSERALARARRSLDGGGESATGAGEPSE